jgi:hypothetical protein
VASETPNAKPAPAIIYNCADECKRRIDLQRVEDERHGGRQIKLHQRLQVAGPIGTHQVALDMSRSAETRERVHEHREKGDDSNDGRLRRPVETEPHHHDWRDADDRQCGDEIADREQPSAKERKAVGDDRDQKPGTTADDVPGQHAENEGLEEVQPKRPKRTEGPCSNRARGRKQHRRHTEATYCNLPQIEHESAEQQRNHNIECARCRLPA